VLDLVTAEGADAAAVALTAAQRVAADGVIAAWAAAAAGISEARVVVLGYGGIPAGGAGDAWSGLRAAADEASLLPLWRTGASGAEPLGTRVVVEVLPASSTSVRVAVASAARSGQPAGTSASDRAAAASGAVSRLDKEPSAAAAAGALARALAPGEGAATSVARHRGPGRWLSPTGVSASGPVPLAPGARMPLSGAAVPAAGLGYDAILGLSIAGAVLLALLIGCLCGGVMFNAWWCCLKCMGRAVSLREKRQLERVARGERTIALATKRRSVVPLTAEAEAAAAAAWDERHTDGTDSRLKTTSSKSRSKSQRKTTSSSKRSMSKRSRSSKKPKSGRAPALELDDEDTDAKPSAGTSGHHKAGWATPSIDSRAKPRTPAGAKGFSRVPADSPLKTDATGHRSPHHV